MLRTPLVRLCALGASAALFSLSACDSDPRREAEAETPVAKAEVSTELPESVVTDEQLQTTANAAAQIASTPPPQIIEIPVNSGQPSGAANTDQAAPAPSQQTTNTVAQ